MEENKVTVETGAEENQEVKTYTQGLRKKNMNFKRELQNSKQKKKSLHLRRIN